MKDQPPYQNTDYKQWITLPPQIPIPYNQNHLHVLYLNFSQIQYLNISMPGINTNGPDNNKNQQSSKNNKFSIRTYWWGHELGYQCLLKTLKIDPKKVNKYLNNQDEFIVQKDSNQQRQAFVPIKFLVCCPINNFLKYCLDMKVLKIQLLSTQLNSIVAKTYINFLTLNNCWQGEPLNLSLPLFSSTFNMNLLNSNKKTTGNNTKIIGEIKLEMKIQKIQNPYKMVPQSMNSIHRQISGKRVNTNSSQEKSHFSREKNKIASNVIDEKRQKESSDKHTNVRKQQNTNSPNGKKSQSGSQFQNDSQFLVQENQINAYNPTRNLINYANFNDKINRRNVKQKTKQSQIKIQDLIPNYENPANIKYSFDSEKIKLQQDFNIVFGMKNPLYTLTNQTEQQNSQTIELKVKVVQNQDLTDLNFQGIKVFIPVIDNESYSESKALKINEYNLRQKQNLLKLEINTKNLKAKQLQEYIKSAVIQVEIYYKMKRKQIQSNDTKKFPKSMKNEDQIVLKGSITLVKILGGCGLETKLQLKTTIKLNQKICECYLKVIPSQAINKTQPNQQKKREQRKQIKQELGWVKIAKFIPLNKNYFRDSNIFVKISTLTIEKHQNLQGNYSNQNMQNQQANVRQVGQTKTLWQAFSNPNNIMAIFENQMMTFPVKILTECQEANDDSQQYLRLQIWNKQAKSFRIGQVILPLNETKARGRLQRQVRDLKNEAVGYLEFWFQRGDVHYINSLSGVHVHKKCEQDKGEEKKKEFKKQNIKHAEQNREQPLKSEDISSQISDDSSRNQQSTQRQSQKLDEPQQQEKLAEMNKFQKLSQQLLKSNDIVQIHYKLFFQIISISQENDGLNFQAYFAQFKQKTKNIRLEKNQSQNMSINQDDQLWISIEELLRFIYEYFAKNLLEKRKSTDFNVNRLSKRKISWVHELFLFYSIQKANESMEMNVNPKLMSLNSFVQSFIAFQTYYTQILEIKDRTFAQFKQVIDSASIQISELESDLVSQIASIQHENKANKISKKLNLTQMMKQTIVNKILKSSRIKINAELQCGTLVQYFLEFYFQRMMKLNSITNKNLLISQAKRLVHLICDQVRKFQLYETTQGSFVEVQNFESVISKNIREILQIDQYIDTRELLKEIELNEIQLTKWETLLLTHSITNNHIKKSKDQTKKRNHKKYSQSQDRMIIENQSGQKIIVKSPTFGLLYA